MKPYAPSAAIGISALLERYRSQSDFDFLRPTGMDLTKPIAPLMLAALFAFIVPARAEQPSGRIDYALTYVPLLHAVLMHGGWNPPNWSPTNEAWAWDGKSWSRWQTPGSPAFAHHTMAYDAKRKMLVICGRPTPHQDGEYQIWENEGKAWTRRANIPVSTSAQGDPKLAYDTRKKRLVLYVASYAREAEVWEFDGKQWQHIKATHQPLRCDDNGCQFQYDESLHKMVLVGEERASKEPLDWDGKEWGMAGGSGTQTWLWDGVDWDQLRGEQPPRAMWGGMAYDRERRRMFLLTTRMETWTLARDKWVKLTPQNSPVPIPNGFFELSYDPAQRVTLFFGGENRRGKAEKDWTYPTATWLYDGQNWASR